MPNNFETGFTNTNKNVRTETKDSPETIDDYESEVTSEYFKDWDDLEIEGNPELKEQIKQNIIWAEKEKEEEYKSTVSYLQLPFPDYILKEKLQKNIESMIEQSEFFVATPVNALKTILQTDGRWKNYLEIVKEGEEKEKKGISMMAYVEMTAFGFNRSENDNDIVKNNKEKRPIYGFLSDEENGVVNEKGTVPPPTNTQQYGPINVKIKKRCALQKATFTGQDSLIGFNLSQTATENPPSPVAKPHFTSIEWDYDENLKLLLDGEFSPSIP